MCGNGSAAITYFARTLGLIAKKASFEINHNIYRSSIDGLTVTGNVQPLTSGTLASISDCTGVTYR